MSFLSKDARRRHKEAFLQKIGAHSSSSEDRSFAEQAKAHSEVVDRVEETLRALSEYRACLEATSQSGENLAKCLEALESAVEGEDEGPALRLLVQRHRKIATVVAPATCHSVKELAEGPLTRASADCLERIAELTAKRRQARLDCDSYQSSRQDRADEARRKFEALTRGCEAEFYSLKSRVRRVAGQVVGSVHGAQCAFFERCAEAFADRLVAHDTSQNFKSFAAAALALCSMNEAELEASVPEPSRLAGHGSEAPTPSTSAESNPFQAVPPAPPSRPLPSCIFDASAARARLPAAYHLMPTGGGPPLVPPQSRPPPPAPPPREQQQQKLPPPPPPREVVVAKHSFVGSRPGELSFEAGDVLYVTMKKSGGWWHGHVAGSSPESAGAFPSSYVVPRDSNTAAAAPL